jgi:hypothetical protein
MYDPQTARFLQEDTYWGETEDPLSLNLYTYCSNNPITYTDPTGHTRQNDDQYSTYIMGNNGVIIMTLQKVRKIHPLKRLF